MRKRRPLSAFLFLSLFFAYGTLYSSAIRAQTADRQHLVEGTVTGRDGKPLAYASVQVKGANAGVVTDENGHFSIEAGKGAVLVVSATSFETQEVPVQNAANLSIVLKGSIYLQDVVVTALGIKRTRNSLPYATQQVTSEDLNRTPTTNFINNLSGKVAGLQITESNELGGTSNVILRGFKSLTQNNQALFVVDGVPFDNSNQSLGGYDLGNVASDINPDDIESITVLKGAAASALYGSRASNGVIEIVTKRANNRNKGIGVIFNERIEVGSVDKSTLPVYQTQYGQGYGSAGYNPAYPSQNGFFYYVPTLGSGGQPENVVQTDQDQVFGPQFNSSELVYNWDAFSPGDPNYGKATPWVAAPHNNPIDFLETPATVISSLYLDGNTDKGSFKLGFTNSTDQGVLPNSDIKKNQLNFGASHDFTDQLSVGGSFNYVNESGLNRNSYDFRSNNTIFRDFRQFWANNVNIRAQKADYFNTLTNATWNWQSSAYTTNTTGDIVRPAYSDNAYWQEYQSYNNDSRQRYFGNVNANYKFTPYLNLTGRVSLDDYNQSFDIRNAIGSVETASFSRYNATFTETNYDLLLNFDKNLGHQFNLKALLGNNIRQDVNSSISAATNGGLVVPGFYALSNSVNTPAAPIETYSEKEVEGLFAGATLTYRELITLDVTGRRDVSSALPKGNNAYFYPAVSGNFLFSKLLTKWNWLSYGKLRANYAEVGGDAPVYSTLNTFNPGTPFNGQTLFTYPTTNNNLHLVPEQNRSYEFGLEASFLHNRVGFDATWYHSQLINQIMPITPSTASGFDNFYVNGGTVQNQGVELTVNVVPVRTKDFNWNLALNWSKNQNKVLSLYAGQPSYTVAAYQNAVQLVAETGKSYGIIRGSDYQYLNGKRLIANGYPVLSANTQSDIGNINPDWLGAVSNTFSYKNWSFNFLIDVKQGGDLYSLDMDYGSWSGMYPATAGKNNSGNPIRSPLSQGGGVLLQGVTADGKPNTVRVDASDINADGSQFPFGSVNSLAAKSYVYDAGYIKLREVALSYSLPAKLIGRTHFLKGLDLSLSGRNLWIIHKNVPYADPEQGSASTTPNSTAPIVYNPNASIGYQTGVFPSVRELAFNIKIKF